MKDRGRVGKNGFDLNIFINFAAKIVIDFRGWEILVYALAWLLLGPA